MSPEGGVLATVGDRLDRLRERETAAVLAGAALGFLLSLGHYLGLVAGGALVGVPAKSTKRALGFGVAFGLLVWALFAAWLAAGGALGAYAGMGQLTLLSVAIPLGLPTLAALAARGLT